jgi:hypothetical protein
LPALTASVDVWWRYIATRPIIGKQRECIGTQLPSIPTDGPIVAGL